MVADIFRCRVHACLYFIAPSGHRLREMDLEFMRRLCTKVNIIPVIGKILLDHWGNINLNFR